MGTTKGIVFLPLELFVFVPWGKSNEWMKKLFFLFRGVFFSGLKKSSELMTCALFQEKKNTKIHKNSEEKKKTQPTFVEKKIGLPQNPNEWQMNISWKKHS